MAIHCDSSKIVTQAFYWIRLYTHHLCVYSLITLISPSRPRINLPLMMCQPAFYGDGRGDSRRTRGIIERSNGLEVERGMEWRPARCAIRLLTYTADPRCPSPPLTVAYG